VIEVRLPRVADGERCARLAALVIGEERAGAFIRSHMERHHLVVAEADDDVVGFLAYRTDWFQCTFVTLVVVMEQYRRKGIAREFFKAVEVMSPTPRLFSSTEETNSVSIRMHTALGFTPSGHIDNLPQGTRELLFYRRIPPRG
jgi:GNAT superfamily N-acetyltransferase